MTTGKIRSVEADGGGVVDANGKRHVFTSADVVPGFTPVVGDKVTFTKRGRSEATDVRRYVPRTEPDGPAAPARPGSRRGEKRTAQRPAGPGRQERHLRPPASSVRLPKRIDPPTNPRTTTAFVNPYNFVPLRPGGVERRSPDFTRRHTVGPQVRLTVRLTFDTIASVSPVQLPGEESSDDGIRQWFVRRLPDDRPWIPGSSLKGALRSVYETLTCSCLSTFDGETTPSWRPVQPSDAGYLLRVSDRVWKILPNETEKASPPPGTRTGDPWDGSGWKGTTGRQRRPEGSWVITDFPESGKKWQRVFVPGKPPTLARANDRELLDVDHAVIEAADIAHAGSHDERDDLEHVEVRETFRLAQRPFGKMAVGDSRPIWYRRTSGESGPVEAIGYVQLYRQVYTTRGTQRVSLGTVLARSAPGARTYQPCSELDSGRLCPACRVFGAVTPSADTGWRAESVGWKGFVSIGSATAVRPLSPQNVVVLRPMGAPHPSAQTFYLWDPTDPGRASGTYASEKAMLRGRKFYWHRPGATASDVQIPPTQFDAIEQEARKKQLNARELLPAGTTFTFEVIADSLADHELGALIMTLEPRRLGGQLGQAGRDLRLKIGGGKPLGMGSATLQITAAEVIADPAVERYGTLRKPTSQPPDLGAWLDERCASAVEHYGISTERDDIRALLALLDWNAVDPSLLRYPPGPTHATAHESHKWFTAFAKRDDKSGAPAATRRGTGPDPLRAAVEIAEERQYQNTWQAAHPQDRNG